jgi:hypothetical protein
MDFVKRWQRKTKEYLNPKKYSREMFSLIQKVSTFHNTYSLDTCQVKKYLFIQVSTKIEKN